MKINLAFDVGIASLGWVITNEKLEIIERKVRLFPTVDNPKDAKLLNLTRRTKRSMRRNKSRRITRKRDFIKYLLDQQLIDIAFDKKATLFIKNFTDKYISNQYDLLALREKGLKEKLEWKELLNVLYWYLSNRGFFYELVDEKNKKAYQKYKKTLKVAQESDELPVYWQKKLFLETGKYKGVWNGYFSNKQYAQEIRSLLEKQEHLVSKTFANHYLEKFFSGYRHYAIGPGNLKTASPYGVFEKDKNGKIYQAYPALWEKPGIIGIDYRGQIRAPRNSYEAQLFNLINDLNNLSYNLVDYQRAKLSTEDKAKIIDLALAYEIKFNKKENQNKYTAKTFKAETVIDYICERYSDDPKNCAQDAKKGINEKDNNKLISGFRIELDKNNKAKPLISKLDLFHQVNKTIFAATEDETKLLQAKNYHPKMMLQNEKGNYFFNGPLKALATLFSNYITKEDRFQELSKYIKKEKEPLLNLDLDETLIKALSAFKVSLNDRHALSFLSLEEEIHELYASQQNHMQWIDKHQKYNENPYQFDENKKYMDKSWTKDFITTPSVIRGVNQTINTFNAILKKYPLDKFEYDNLVMEMPRDTNNKAERERITKMNARNREDNKKVQSTISGLEDQKLSPHQNLKVKLWLEQESKDAYDGQFIHHNDLLENAGKYEVDHIIPYSLSFDNSLKNKVLTKKFHNQKKSNQIPSKYLGSAQTNSMHQTYWKKWYANNQQKLTKLTLLESELSEHLNGFIARNLVDARYIARTLLAAMQAFLKSQKAKTKIKVATGKMTSHVRKLIEIEAKKADFKLYRAPGLEDQFDKEGKKNRIWYGQHSEDAYFALVNALHPRVAKIIEKALSHQFALDNQKIYDATHQFDLINKQSGQELYGSEFLKNIVDELNRSYDDVKFSRMFTPKNTVELFNETLYEGRKLDNGMIQKINKIELHKINWERDKEKTLMFQYDKPTFEELDQIYQNYKDHKNPFKAAAQAQDKIDFKDKKMLDEWEFTGIRLKKDRIVSKLRVLKEEKDPNTIIVPKIYKSDYKRPFYESLNWTELHLYKNEKNRYVIIAINALNAFISANSEPIIKKEFYEQQKTNYNISKDTKILYIFKKGFILQDPEKQFYYLAGFDMRSQRFDLKYLDHKLKIPRLFKGINSIAAWKAGTVDYLGNFTKDFTFTNASVQTTEKML